MSLSTKAFGKRLSLLAALVAALVVACAGVVGAQQVSHSSSAADEVSVAANVSNGDFESGDFSGWKVANRRESGFEGDWFVYSGTTSPLNGFTVATPPQGDFAATTDQSDPGSHVLYRNIKLEAGMNHTLSFYLYYVNDNGEFITPNTLSFAREDNQQYRVDLMKPKSKPFSMKNDAIRENLFRTDVGDPNTLGPALMLFDLTPYAGKTVRLRFAEVDNQGNFLASVDDVKVSSE